jgi:hypothetical protein
LIFANITIFKFKQTLFDYLANEISTVVFDDLIGGKTSINSPVS